MRRARCIARSTPGASCPTPSPASGRPSAPWAPPSCSSAIPAPCRPRSSAGVPCPRTPYARSRSRVLGGLVLVFAGPRSLYEAETRLLAAYADQLAMALDNAALFEEAENKKTQLEQVFASTTDGFLVADLSGRIVAFNRQGGDLLGISPDDVIGRPFHRLVETLGPAVGWETPGGQALENVIAGGRPEEIGRASCRERV